MKAAVVLTLFCWFIWWFICWFICWFIWLHQVLVAAWELLDPVPWPGIEPRPSALEAWCLSQCPDHTVFCGMVSWFSSCFPAVTPQSPWPVHPHSSASQCWSTWSLQSSILLFSFWTSLILQFQMNRVRRAEPRTGYSGMLLYPGMVPTHASPPRTSPSTFHPNLALFQDSPSQRMTALSIPCIDFCGHVTLLQ